MSDKEKKYPWYVYLLVGLGMGVDVILVLGIIGLIGMFFYKIITNN